MHAEHTESPTAGAGVTALTLAVGAALSLALARALHVGTDADGLATLAFLLGWTLAAWGVIAVVALAVHLVRVAARRRPAAREILLVAAGAAVLVATVLAVPPFGTGAGAG
jgi:hypothetical protein